MNRYNNDHGAMLLSILFGSSVLIPVHARASDTAAYSDDRVTIRAVEKKGSYAKLVVTEGLRSPRELSFASVPEHIELIRRVRGGRLLAKADVGEGVKEIAVLDAAAIQIEADFLCYKPEISPDGKYLIFAKFYPIHPGGFAPSNLDSNFAELYDLTNLVSVNLDPRYDVNSA